MSNLYYNQPLDWLQAEVVKWREAHSALTSGKEYEIFSNGTKRRLNRFDDLAMVKQTMYDLQAEITRQQDATDTPTRVSYADFNCNT